MFDRRLFAVVAVLGCVTAVTALASASAKEWQKQAGTKSAQPAPAEEPPAIDSSKASYTVDVQFTGRDGDVLFAPKITVFADQQAEVGEQVIRPFVTAVGETDGKAVPHIDTIECGTRAMVVVREGRGGVVTLDLTVARPDIEDVTTRGDVQAVRVECRTVRVIQPVQLGQRVKVPFGDDDKSAINVVVTRAE